MSVLISGMEMPPIDLEWRIIRCQDGKWYAIDVNAETSDGEWHEIVPVPPHGRLIDADELHSALRKRAKEFSSSEYGDGVKCGLADAREYIKMAPTIIPAEEGE